MRTRFQEKTTRGPNKKRTHKFEKEKISFCSCQLIDLAVQQVLRMRVRRAMKKLQSAAPNG